MSTTTTTEDEPHSPTWTGGVDAVKKVTGSPDMSATAAALAPGHAYVARAAQGKGKNWMWFLTRRMFLTDRVLAQYGCAAAFLVGSFVPAAREAFSSLVSKVFGNNNNNNAAPRLGALGLGLAAATTLEVAGRFVVFWRKITQNVRHEYDEGPDVRRQPYYKDAALLARAPKGIYPTDAAEKSSSGAGSRSPCGAVVHQPVEGYCGHAAVLTILRSLGVDPLPQVPSSPEPLDLPHIRAFLAHFCSPLGATVSIVSSPFTLEEFRAICRRSGDPAYRYCINYLRRPLFWNDPAHPDPNVPRISRVFGGGHFSVIAGTVPTEEYGELVVLHDVNEKYSTQLVPLEQLWKGANTRSLMGKEERGLVEVKLADADVLKK